MPSEGSATLTKQTCRAPRGTSQAKVCRLFTRSAILSLALTLAVGCASYRGLGVEITNPLDGSGKIVEEKNGIHVQVEGIGWTREMISSLVIRTYATVRVRNERAQRLILERNKIRLGLPDPELGEIPYKMVLSPDGHNEKKTAINPGEEIALKLEFTTFSISRRREGAIRLRFEEDGTKDLTEVLVPVYLKKVPLDDPERYKNYLKSSAFSATNSNSPPTAGQRCSSYPETASLRDLV
jgi:hypothetical protein